MLYAPVPMHIPDGFLIDGGVGGRLGDCRRRRRDGLAADAGEGLGERQVPVMGVLAAFIFAAQAINFPVTAGTSGHLLGAALAAIVLGPWAAVVVLTTVVSGPGAASSRTGACSLLGRNVLNMAVIGVAVSYFVYTTLRRLAGERTWAVFAAAFIAAWTSIVVASLACALELALSGTSPANIAVPAMGGIHALIGIGEGLITLGALAFLWTTRRDLVQSGAAAPKGGAWVWVTGLAVALGLAVLSPLASAHPDGLEPFAAASGLPRHRARPTVPNHPGLLIPRSLATRRWRRSWPASSELCSSSASRWERHTPGDAGTAPADGCRRRWRQART